MPVPSLVAEAWLQRIFALGPYSDSILRALKQPTADISPNELLDEFLDALDDDAERFFSEEVLVASGC